MSADVTLYTAPALAEAAGVTLRQVQHWTNEGLLQPADIVGLPKSGMGNRRVYALSEAAVARRIAALTSVRLDDAGKVARHLTEGEPEVRLGDLVIRIADRSDGEARP